MRENEILFPISDEELTTTTPTPQVPPEPEKETKKSFGIYDRILNFVNYSSSSSLLKSDKEKEKEKEKLENTSSTSPRSNSPVQPQLNLSMDENSIETIEELEKESKLPDLNDKKFSSGETNLSISPSKFQPPMAVPNTPEKIKKKEYKGSLQVQFTTMFHPEEISFIIDPNQSDTLDLLQNIQDQLSSKEERRSSLEMSGSKLKKATPMVQGLILISLPPFDYGYSQFPNEVTLFLTLKKLHIIQNNLSSLPASISQLLSLESLHLSHNQLKSLPSEIKFLTNLKDLDISHNLISSLPPIGTLIHLQTLIINENQISLLPNDIELLTNLQTLSCSQNKISYLPQGMKHLVSLTYLNFESNYLSSIIDKKGRELWIDITKLKTLNLKKNRLTSIGFSIGNLVELTDLDISINSFIILPKEIGSLKSLLSFKLSTCGLTSLPNEISKLTQLNTLIADHNKLSSVPCLKSLTALQELHLGNNILSTFPSLPLSLVSLDLGCNSLTEFPSILASFPSLTNLNFSSNTISTLTPDLFLDANPFPSLTSLNISNNSVKNLPTQITKLQTLKELNISENLLIIIPEELKYLSNLTKLSLHSSKLSVVITRDLPPLLEQLTLMNLSINKISKEVKVIRPEPTLVHQIPGLIACARSTPHSLTVFALSYLSTLNECKPILIKSSLKDFFSFLDHQNEEIRNESLRALTNLYQDAKCSFEPTYASSVFELVKNSQNLTTRKEAIRLLGNICLNDAHRNVFLEKYGVEAFIKMYEADNPIEIQQSLNRLLNIIGTHDYLHFPPERKNGIRILCMDGGGTRGLVTIEVLKRLEKLTGQRISELFDLIAGTSTGGIVAVMTGVHNMPLEQLETLYKNFSSAVFVKGSKPEPDASSWSKLASYAGLFKNGSFYKGKTLLDILAEYVGTVPLIDTSMGEHAQKTKIFFVSTVVSAVPPQNYIFRNYNYPVNSKSRYMGNCTFPVCNALRASTAAPPYFEEYVSLDNSEDRFQDGGITANNPTAIAIHEARCLWPNRPIECIVNIGTGSVGVRPQKKQSFLPGLLTTLAKAATNSSTIDWVISDLLSVTGSNIVYHRFNPIDEVFACELDETDEEVLKLCQDKTNEFIDQNIETFTKLAELLSQPLYKNKTKQKLEINQEERDLKEEIKQKERDLNEEIKEETKEVKEEEKEEIKEEIIEEEEKEIKET